MTEEQIKAAIDEGMVASISFGAQGVVIPCANCPAPHRVVRLQLWWDGATYIGMAALLDEKPPVCRGDWGEVWDMTMGDLALVRGAGGIGEWEVQRND